MSTETKTLTNADAKIQPKLGVKALVQIGMLSAIAVVLMMFDIHFRLHRHFIRLI